MRFFLTSSAKETQQIAKKFAREMSKYSQRSKGALVVGLTGNLGSGKTTFVQGFAHALGVREKVLSPTFVIIKKYKINSKLKIRNLKFQYMYHIDCYRIEHEEDMVRLDWGIIVSDPQNLVFIEWPERVKKILPNDTLYISFEAINEHKRKVSFG